MHVVSPFERVAQAVTERVAELLSAHTWVLDARNHVVASSKPAWLVAAAAPDRAEPYLRVPMRLDAQMGEVVVSKPHSGEVISPRLAQVLVELVINQTAVVERAGGSWADQHQLKHTFIHDLLHGKLDDEATILREARLLGMDFTPPRAVILIDATAYILAPTETGQEASDTQIRRRTHMIIGSIVNFFHLPNDTICAYIGDGEVAVLKASNTQNLITWADGGDQGEVFGASWANLVALKRAGGLLLTHLHSDTSAVVTMGIGRYHPGVCGLARSYQDARAALSLGRRFHGQHGVHCLDGLGVAAFVGVADERTKIDLATYLLSPLDHEPELLETLSAFFADDCCPSATAKQLSIHRNTLSYRLEKITLLTGLNPRIFDDAVQIRLALLLRTLRHASA